MAQTARRHAEVERKITLGIDLVALRSIATTDRDFNRMLREHYQIDRANAATCARVARLYGDRRDISGRLSWRALVELAAVSMPEAVRCELEKRILAGERIGATEIRRARGQHRTAPWAAS
jgi:hypothetical protein